MTSRREPIVWSVALLNPPRHRALLLLLATFLCLGLIYNRATPVFESGDEISHYPFVKHLADGGDLPVQRPSEPRPWHQEGSQPPLYYAALGLATSWIDTGDFDTVRQLNPHAKLAVLDAPDNNNLVVHNPEREAFPWGGTVLAVNLSRLLSLLLAASAVACTYFAALLAFPGRRPLALGAAALQAFNPMFLFTSASVSNDTLATAVCSLAFLLSLRLLREGPSGSWGELLLLGLVLAAGALSKLSALTVLPLAGLAVLVAARRQRDWRLVARGAIALGGPVLLMSGWWYARNWQLYGDLTGLALMVGAEGARPPGFGLIDALGEWEAIRHTFWGVFGAVTVGPPPWLYPLGDALLAAAGAGLLFWGAGLAKRRQAPGWPVGLMLVFVALAIASLLRWTMTTPASLGRLLFPSWSALAPLLALGLAELGNALVGLVARPAGHPRRGRDLAAPALAAPLAGVAAAVALACIQPVYAPPAPLSAAAEAAIPHRAEAVYAGQIALVGYELDRQTVQVGESLRLTLYWRAQASLDHDYSVFVHLVDGKPEEKLGQQDSYPAGGRLSTRWLPPGQVIADTHLVPVSRLPKNGEAGQILVGLYDAADGSRPLATDAQGRVLDAQPLATVTVRAASQ
ncbi:MAG: glycosyltransferase family 39 protein [Chloroflexota bacterium]